MARDLKDKVMVITGGSAGIGAATAVAGARAGMKVVVAARREEELKRVVERVESVGGEGLAVVCDVAKDGDVESLVAKTVERFGGVDVMFANAGYGLFMPVEHMTDEATRRIFEVNYYGTIRCVKAAIPQMRRRGGGHIVITSSIVGRVGLPFYAQYSATKAAQDALGTGLAGGAWSRTGSTSRCCIRSGRRRSFSR